MRWADRGYHRKIFVDGTGRVLGEVLQMTGDSEWMVNYDGTPLGIYVDLPSAQTAVEQRHKNKGRVSVR